METLPRYSFSLKFLTTLLGRCLRLLNIPINQGELMGNLFSQGNRMNANVVNL